MHKSHRDQAGLVRSLLFESSRQKRRQTARLGLGRFAGGAAALSDQWRHQEAHLESERRKERHRLLIFDVKRDDEEGETACRGAFFVLKIDDESFFVYLLRWHLTKPEF